MRLALLAVLCLLSPHVMADPCETSTVMREGSTAQCTGILTPARRAAQCVADGESLTACQVRLAGEVSARLVADEGCARRVGILEAAVETERQVARETPPTVTRTDWGAVGWGVAGGVVVGAAAVLLAVFAR